MLRLPPHVLLFAAALPAQAAAARLLLAQAAKGGDAHARHAPPLGCLASNGAPASPAAAASRRGAAEMLRKGEADLVVRPSGLAGRLMVEGAAHPPLRPVAGSSFIRSSQF